MASLNQRQRQTIGGTILALVLACSILLLPACANSSSTSAKDGSEASSTSTEQSASTEATAKLEGGVSKIGSGGNVTLTLKANELLKTFARGDILSVACGDKVADVPLVTEYTSLDSGASGIVAREDKDTTVLATNMGNFAETYGVTDDTHFVISLKEAGGYLEDLRMRDLTYTDERAEYPNLSDAEFANFRVVDTTGMGKNTLYRGASPINPKHKRNTYADAALKDARVKTIMNLSDTEEEAVAFPGYNGTYYASVSHTALGMGYDFQSEDFQEKLVSGLRYLTSNEGPYYIHCLEGKDRTGFVAAMLECLMGASYDEVVSDYMRTFANYYGVKPDDQRYEYLAQHGIVLSLKRVFDVEDLKSVDLAAKAEEYLKGIGLTQDEVTAIKTKLS